MISVVIPVKNGGRDLQRCLEAVAAQRLAEPVEVVVIDSGSSDGSVALADSYGAVVREIAPSDFNHGRARNLGAELAGGDVLVFTTQDAYAADDGWLAALVAPLADPNVAGVYARQLPHDDATPPERYFLDFMYGPDPRIQRAAGTDEISYESTLFSNVGSAVPKAIWQEHPFAEDLLMSEDQEWSRRVLLAGYSIVYEPRAAVRHSHSYTIAQAFRRFFDSGASAERGYLGGRHARASIRRAGVRYAAGEARWLWRTGQRRWLPYAALYELAKFTGLQLGSRHRRLPRTLGRRLSALPEQWDETLGKRP